MRQALRFLEVFALGTWVGAIVYFAAVVTRGAFAVLPNADMAGALVGFTIRGLHWFGIAAAVVYLAAAVGLGKSLQALWQPAALAVVLMLALTLASQGLVVARMDAVRAKMVSVAGTPRDNPLRIKFDRLHRVSVGLESGVLLIGLAALYVTVREASR